MHGTGDSFGQYCREDGKKNEQCTQYDGSYPETDDYWGDEIPEADRSDYTYTCREVGENPENGTFELVFVFKDQVPKFV